MIRNLLKNKTVDERATLKGFEISKIGFIKKTKQKDYFIEVVSFESMPSGVCAFVRAWDKDDIQVGFGPDGSVDIERFKIHNPPILVPDPNGDILQTWETSQGVQESRRLREDPQEAILQHIDAVIKGKKEKHGPKNIISGKIGNTTSTFASAEGANSPVDGWLQNAQQETGWAACRNGTGSVSIGGGATQATSELGVGTQPSNTQYQIDRSFLLFDVSSIGSSDTITAANIQLWHTSKRDEDDDANAYIALVRTCPASDANIVGGASGDWTKIAATDDGCGFTSGEIFKEYSDQKDITNITTGAYTTYTGNASMLSLITTAVSGDNIVRLGAAEGHDINDSQTTESAGVRSEARHYLVDQTGTSNDPILTVEHGAGAAVVVPRLLTMKVG